MKSVLALGSVALLAMASATRAASPVVEGWQPFDPPAAAGAIAPWLLADRGELLLSWVEAPSAEGGPHRVLFSSWRDSRWTPPVPIAAGTDLFVNWADTPGLGAAGNGDLYAHWLRRLGEDKYAYGVEIGRSGDRGATWSTLGFVHEDRSATEHGFASWAADGEGIRVAWLDGRETASGGAMTLRSTRLGGSSGGVAIATTEVVDDRVCDCCSTALAATPRGVVAAYRDRTTGEIRDILTSRRGQDGWTAGSAVHADGWKILGCPVNGPQVAAGAGDQVAVAWFTDAPPAAGQERSRVRWALSTDAGETFGPVLSLAGDGALGRVGMAAVPGEFVVTWLASTETGAEIRARRVSADGRVGEAVPLVRTSVSRASGIPRLAAAAGGRLVLVWVEPGEASAPGRLRAASFPPESLPAPKMAAGHCG